jgi:eukaryotic-like serine/threonine-protein kinase
LGRHVDIEAGAVLRGKYRVERVLGEGGMGRVVAAWDPDLERRVAVKILRPEVANKPEAVERFLREARAAAKIESDHVVRVIEVGSLDDGAPFMVMEHLEGHDLAEVPERRELPSPEQAVGWVLEACQAIRAAHALGIVHRDLKPANLFLAARPDGPPRIKVLDFGISKVPSDETRPSVTSTNSVMGSPLYMAPEQMLSTRDADARADVWALGVILYELCTGKVPFEGQSITALYVLATTRKPAAPRSLRPAIPEGLSAVILASLAPERDQRVQSVAALMDRLQPFAPASHAGIAAARTQVSGSVWPGASARTDRSPSGTIAVSSDRPAAAQVRRRWIAGLALAGLLGAGGIAALLVTRSGGPPRAAAPSAVPSATLAAQPEAPPASTGTSTDAPSVSLAPPPEPGPSASASAPSKRGAPPAHPSARPSTGPTPTSHRPKDSYD